jgi:C4-dicarboxylate-specific signal transduction histidine kinase
VGKALLDFVHLDFRQQTLERIKFLSLLGELVPLVELKLLKMDGAVIDGEAQSTTILFDGAPAIQIYLRDTTQRKRQASELSALRTEMQTMMEWQVARHTVAALAHEINQPLASMSVLCEAAGRMLVSHDLAQGSGGAHPKLAQALQRMASETQRAGVVVRQLVKSMQQPDIALEPIGLSELLRDAANMVLDEGRFDCQIHISCPTDLPPVRANRLKITKVLLNLLGNAAQAMQSAQNAPGEIWIDAVLAQGATVVDVSVRDAGPGVTAEQELAIFQPFFTTKSHGLGMGLVISRALIEAHGGKLWLQAPAGLGATFHFTLPTTRQSL